MSGATKKDEHDSRLIELNRLLKNGEPNINRMKELYHAISPKYLSRANIQMYAVLGDYLNRRLAGMDHMIAYTSSMIRENDVETCHKVGTKAAKRSTMTRLKDKIAVKEIEEIMKQTLEEAKTKGIPEDAVKIMLNQMIKAQGFRPEFMRSVEKATNKLMVENTYSSGGGAGTDPIEEPAK